MAPALHGVSGGTVACHNVFIPMPRMKIPGLSSITFEAQNIRTRLRIPLSMDHAEF